MHRSGPPSKFFRSSGGPRIPTPSAQQDFTVDYDTPPGAFHQSHPSGQPYLPPPMDGPPHLLTHGHPRVRAQFGSPYPPPHYGHYPMPPRFCYSPQQWGQSYGYQGRGGWRGRGRGRHSSGGRGGRYSQPKWRNEGSDMQSSSDGDAYYSKTMFEDPWKDLLPEGDQCEDTTVPDSIDITQDTISVEEETASSKLGNTSNSGVEDPSDIVHDVDSSLIGSNSEDIPNTQSDVNLPETKSSPHSNCQSGDDVLNMDCPDTIGTESGIKL